MMHKVAGEFVLALLLLQVTKTDASVFMPTFARAAMPSIGGFSLMEPLPRLPVAQERVLSPRKTDMTAVGVTTSAQSVVVLDAASGALLYAEEPDVVRSLGSITKLMTAIVFLEMNPDLSSWVTVLPEDFAGGGRAYLVYNDPARLGDVLSASLVGSDNTATEALVRLSGLSRDAFISRMNARARELGLLSTRFVDPSGLSADNQSTAREISLILAHATQFDALTDRTQMPVATFVQSSGNSVSVPTTNLLLGSSFLDTEFSFLAGKTGYIPQAGYCFTGAFLHNGHRIYTTVLGSDTKDARFTDAANVTDWVTRVYTWPVY